MWVILFTLAKLSLSVIINHALLALNQTSYTYTVDKPINVTVGEEFSLVLAGLDTVVGNFTIYELSEESFLSLFESTNDNHAETQRKKVPNTTFSCQIIPPAIEIERTLTRVHNPSAFGIGGKPKHALIHSYNLLYLLNPEMNDLTAYYYNEEKMEAQASYRLPMPSNKKDNRIAMAASSNQSYVYIMGTTGMWRIESKTILARVEKIPSLGGFDSKQHKIDDLLHGWNGWLVGINKLRSVYIIPEDPESEHAYKQIRSFKNIFIAPQDIYIQGYFLYILDLHHGIYIYKRFVNGTILQHDMIEHESYGNMKLLVKDKNIFINYNDEYGNKIIQFNYENGKRAELVRYYKDQEFISSMSVNMVKVSSPDPHSENSRESLLFLVADNGEILAYPYNLDPRTIHTPHSSVKTLVEGGNSLHFLFRDQYLLITSSGFLYVKLLINRPQFICHKTASDKQMFYQIEFETNVSSCQHFAHSTNPQKYFYNTNCRLKTVYSIAVNDPDRSWFEKVFLYGVVILTIVAFVIGLLFMVQWRKGKLYVLGRIKDEIQKFREKHRQMQPFAEEEPHKKQDLEFELPEQPIDHDLD